LSAIKKSVAFAWNFQQFAARPCSAAMRSVQRLARAEPLISSRRSPIFEASTVNQLIELDRDVHFPQISPLLGLPPSACRRKRLKVLFVCQQQCVDGALRMLF